MSGASREPEGQTPTDEALAVAGRAGDLAAFDTLARRYQDRLFTYALRMARDRHAAADLAQETLVRAFRSLGRFDAEQRFAPWVFGIAAHVCRDWLRRQGRRREQAWDDLDGPAPAATPAEQAAAAEERERVVEAVGRLPEKYREVIVLHYLDEMPYDDVARALGITPEAARRRALRAREMLRKRLGGQAERRADP
jgi:RNA polymerase sigma-70 factor (ECF subfamily)